MRSFETVLALLLLSTLFTVLARWLKQPAPIVLVLGGLGLALIPAMPKVEIAPDLAFTIFVPPLLFRAALGTSLRGLQRDARSVFLLAVGLVVATMAGVGLIAHLALPELALGAAFVLGAVLSPPDALVGISLARSLNVPKRIINLIEGETLFNDAAAFVIYRQAVQAVSTGSFSLPLAVPRFLLVAAGGAGVGFAVFWIIGRTRKWIDEPLIENVVWLCVPFLAFLPAEALGASGVLAVVVAGVLFRRRNPRDVAARTRTQATAIYDIVEFILDGLIFVLIGLDLGAILRDPHTPRLLYLLRATGIVTAAVIAIRFLWIFATAYIPFLNGALRDRDTQKHHIKGVLLLAWMGVRGGDSLVTALAVPLTTLEGKPFPDRDLLVAIAFGVILATLLLQGLTMAPLIRWLKFAPDETLPIEEEKASQAMQDAERKQLAELVSGSGSSSELIIGVAREHLHKETLKTRVAESGQQGVQELRRIELALIGARREAAVQLRDEQVIDDDLLREIEAELDLEELRLPEADD